MQGHSSYNSSQDPQAISDLLSTILILCQGADERGKPCWAYLCIKPSMAKAFSDARQQHSFDIGDYGTIIESGEGETVPDEIQAKMARDYGVRHDYEEQLAYAVEKIKANYLD